MNATLKIKRIIMQHQLFSLDLGIIQHVIDDHQQRLARVFDGVGIQYLFFGQVGILQQLGHANNAVHRGADLMAHIGEER